MKKNHHEHFIRPPVTTVHGRPNNLCLLTRLIGLRPIIRTFFIETRLVIFQRPVARQADADATQLDSFMRLVVVGGVYRALQTATTDAARLEFSARKSGHITPKLRELHWLKAPEGSPVSVRCAADL